MHWSHTVGGGKISYVIEAGHKGQKYVDKVLMPLVANRASQAFYKMNSYTWAGKGNAMIQVADLLAHEVASFQEGKISPALECFDGFVQVNRLGRQKLMEQMDIMNEMEREAKRDERSLVVRGEKPIQRLPIEHREFFEVDRIDPPLT